MNLFDVYPVFDIALKRGEGCYVYDDLDQTYLDLYGGHAVISIGHSHPHFIERISGQLQDLAFYSNSIKNPVQVALSKKLGQLSLMEDYQLFLCNSGAEANENALKMASFASGKSKVICFEGAFHGRTSAAVNITDNPKIKAAINETFEVVFLPWNDAEAVKTELMRGDSCAVILEGIQGIGGVHVAEPSFLRQISTWCQKFDVSLILDEIQSGYGRTGNFFAFQKAGIKPDLVTMAKGMGNGFPIGGVLLNPKFVAHHGMLGTTFGGSHLACSAGLGVLEVIENEGLIENARNMGEYFFHDCPQLKGLVEVRGEGLMIGMEFEFPIVELRRDLLFHHRIFTGSSKNPNVLRILPPLSIRKHEIDKFFMAIQSATN